MNLPTLPRRFVPLLALSAAVAVSAGCVPDTRPDVEICALDEITLELVLADDELSGDELAVCRGQRVVMQIDVQQDGVIHIHGYDDQAADVRSGDEAEFDFVANRSGQFPIELHTTEEPSGVDIGIFTVHEP